MATILWRRQMDIAGKVNDVKDSVSSWDKCMTKAYCKWPVIVAIVVGTLILLSLLWCLFRCLCCGAECACCCFRCCAGCCGGGGRRKHEPLSSAPPTRHHPGPVTTQQYSSPVAPSYAHVAPSPGRAQFASFDVSKKGAGKTNEDSLPAMPSWEAAQSRKVEYYDESEQHEMNHLDKNGQHAAGLGAPLPGFAAPGSQHSSARPSPGLTPQGSYIGSDMGAGGAYGGGPGLASDSHTGYRGAAPSPLPPYGGSTSDIGTAVSGVGAGYARRSPPRGSPAHSPVGQNAPYGSMDAYGNAPRQSPIHHSPTYNNGSYLLSGPGPARRSPTGQQYGRSSPAGQGQRSPAAYQQASTTYNDSPQANQYHAYQPGAPQQQQGGGGGYGYDSAPNRKPVNGSWRDV